MNKKGQALVEYVLIIALVSIVAIALVNYFGGFLKDAITKTSCSMLGQEFVAPSKENGLKAGEGYCQ